MSKALVLAEKPSVGRDIARVMGCQNKGTYFESDKYVVTWAMGHLVSLAQPEKYELDYGHWMFHNMPVIPQPFKLEVLKGTGKQYSIVRKLLDRSDVKEIIIATDAGREGELVARWILEKSHCKKKIRRLWISSVTDQAIKQGFAHLKDGREFDGLYGAARARAKADWVVGLNGTRALSLKFNTSLSLGRVQTPTLNLVHKREEAIRNFVPQNYDEITTNVQGITCHYVEGKALARRIFDEKRAMDICKKSKESTFKVVSINKKERQIHKIGFYDLTELQRDADRLYHFSAKQTLRSMQELYERHKVLTYPRTDSKYITKDIVPTLKDRLRACKNSGNQEFVSEIFKSGVGGRPSFVNDQKVGDHHGIIPTEIAPNYSAFSNEALKIYNLVVERFLAVLMPAYRYEETTLILRGDGGEFRGKSNVVLDLGWKALYEKAGTEEKKSLKLGAGDEIKLNQVLVTRHKTSPPGYLTEGDLLHEMEKAGLGTVATRAEMIEKIIGYNYVDKQGDVLRTTSTGRQLLKSVPESIRSEKLTAQWEKKLEAISKNQYDENKFLNEMFAYAKEIVQGIEASEESFKHDNLSTEVCPECGKRLLYVQNKYGKKLVCQDRSCGYKKTVAKATNARCPNCHKKMQLVGDKGSETFVCSCGHREKLKAFEEKRKTQNKTMGKREVQKYLNKQEKKEENFNNPFADLLKQMEDK